MTTLPILQPALAAAPEVGAIEAGLRALWPVAQRRLSTWRALPTRLSLMRRFRPYLKYLRAVRGPLYGGLFFAVVYGATGGLALSYIIKEHKTIEEKVVALALTDGAMMLAAPDASWPEPKLWPSS